MKLNFTKLLAALKSIDWFSIFKMIQGAAEEALKGDAHLQPPPTPPVVPVAPPIPPKYMWDTKGHVVHSIRVICDEKGMSLEQKNTMTATIGAESEYNPKAHYENIYAGKLWSTDWGLCQWNDHYHGKEITPYEAVHDPEKAVRLMADYWKRGQRAQWSAYKNGSYKHYL